MGVITDFLPMGKLLGLDHGLKRIGVAVCDSTQLVARELAIIKRASKVEDFEKINRMAAEQQAVGMVIGLPLDLDAPDDAPKQADRVRLWAERLAETTDLPLILWDEQLSSEEAKQLAKLRRRKPAAPIDDLAARVILQRYLDARRDAPPPGGE